MEKDKELYVVGDILVRKAWLPNHVEIDPNFPMIMPLEVDNNKVRWAYFGIVLASTMFGCCNKTRFDNDIRNNWINIADAGLD